MECHTMGSVSPGSYGVEKHITWLLCPTVKLNSKNVHKFQCNTRMGPQRLSLSYQAYRGKHFMRHTCWRTFCTPVTLEEELLSRQSENHSNDDDFSAEVSAKEEVIVQPLNSLELKTLIADSERAKLMKKLSEANQQNRFLKRQLYAKEDALVNFKSDLAVMELEIQALVTLADEIAKSAIPVGSRKINGKYIQSHLSTRLEAVREKLKEQIEDVEAARSKEVPIFWRGMAESVQIMGSFDGWSQGEHLSPEYTGSFTNGKTFREQVLRWFTFHNIPRVDSIVLTHEHADAVLGLDDIRAVQPHSPTNDIDPTPIYLTQYAMESIGVKFPYLVQKKLKAGQEVRRVAQLDWKIIENNCNKPFVASGLELVPLPVMHGEDYVSLGFLFGENYRVAYISDISRFLPDTEHYLLKNGRHLDLLILDTLYKKGSHNTHFCLPQTLEAVKKLRPKRALLTGMTHEFDHHKDNEFLVEWSRREGIPVQLAQDGLRIPVDL